MWRQDDLFNVLGAGGQAARGIAPIESVEAAADRLDPEGPRPPLTLVCCPLMHGTGQFSAFITLNQGGAVATLPSRGFSAAELWNEVDRLRVDGVVIVGLAFSTPMLEALEAEPGRWDLTSVLSISSSGSMWSQENKRGLDRGLRARPHLRRLHGGRAEGNPGLGRARPRGRQRLPAGRLLQGP